MGSVQLTLYRATLFEKISTLLINMAFRIFSDVSNIPTAVENRRVTRASRKVLGEIPGKNLPQASKGCIGKENVVDNLQKGQKKAPRPSKVAARRLNIVMGEQQPMEVEYVEEVPRIPEGVKDIDAEDASNPQLCTEYALEIYAYLKQLEKRGSVRPDYLLGCPTSDKMRAVLVDWLVEVQIQFKLLQETLFLTVNTIDRFLAIEGKTLHRSKLQLVGVAAMFLVSKIEEVYAPAVSDFVYITDNAYTESEIKQMELRIIRALSFDLCQPIALNFLRRYSKAGEVDVLQHSLAKFSLEVSLLDTNLMSVPGSLLASACLCLAILLLDSSTSHLTVWTKNLAFYSGYSQAAVLELLPRVASNLVSFIKSNKLLAIKNKYKSSKFLKVAELPELTGERILELAEGF